MNAQISISIVNDVVNIEVTGATATLINTPPVPPVAPPAADGWSPADEVGEIVTKVDQQVAEAEATAAETAEAVEAEAGSGKDETGTVKP